ncbi:MAG: hypothetical protein QXS54_08805 [Candidatus Methanomethylicaceae archaeon]
MKHRKLFLGILLVLAAAGIALGLYAQVTAQQEVAEYLKERLDRQNIPVVEITARRLLPLHLEIIIQSMSEGEKALPDDPINLHIVRREVMLARQQGYIIDGFTLTLLNKQGRTIFWTEAPIDIENVPLELSPSKLDDAVTKDIIAESINLYGMSLIDTEIISSEGIQTLVLRLSTPSLEEANQALPYFMPSLRPFIADINTQGAQIVICKVEVVDEKEQILLEYLLDLQLDSETWWMVDGLTQDWFPHPPSE